MPVRDLWRMWPESISYDVIEEIESICSENLIINRATSGNNSTSPHDHLDGMRGGEYRTADGIDDLNNLILGYVNQVNEEVFRFDIEKLGDVTYTNYGKYRDTGGNSRCWHMDSSFSSPKAIQKKLSVHIQLADPTEYEGGDFIFKDVENPPADKLRKKGTVLVFPSYLEHKITKVTSGEYRNITAFVLGPAWV
jgi:PKHD-type hydroxylase